ncbi:ovocalyxin-32-like [Rhinophrynus dorsalis]
MQLRFCLLVVLPLAIQALPFAVPKTFWSVKELPTNHREARAAARVVVQYINYNSGSPYHLVHLDEVKTSTVKSIPEIGKKFYIEFTTKDFHTNQNAGTCIATVFYRPDHPHPAIKVDCPNRSMKQAYEEDYSFYKKMKMQTTPISGTDIPDSFGFIEPDLLPVWYMAVMGSGYVIWEKTTEDRSYSMAQIKSVKQVLRKDDLISFDYDILLHELPTEEMVNCSLHVIWKPGKPPKVDYHCSHDSGNGSGREPEEGSGFLGNFK